jgi:hypothetical protein
VGAKHLTSSKEHNGMASSNRPAAGQKDTETSAKTPDAPRNRVSRPGWLSRMLRDIFFVARRDKKWLLLPLILFLLILAVVLAMAAMAGPLAPFIYPIL